MNKAAMIAKIAEKTDLTKKQAEAALNAFTETVLEALKEGDKVMVGGGIHATVRRVDLTAGTVDVEIARGVVVTVDKAGVFADGTQQPQK